MRKDRCAIQPHRHAALKIRRNNQRQLRDLLQPVQQLGGHIGLALQQHRAIHRHGHAQRADVIFADVVAQLNPDGIGVIQELHLRPDHEELPDFLFGRHPAQRLVGPLAPVAIKMNGPGRCKALFGLVFGKAGAAQKINVDSSRYRSMLLTITNLKRRIERRTTPGPIGKYF